MNDYRNISYLERKSSYEEKNSFVAYFNKSVSIENLILDEAYKDCAFIVINGDLKVHENIINEDSNIGVNLIVMGNLQSRNMIAGGSEIVVTGRSVVDEMVLAHYNDGVLSLHELSTKVLLNSDHYVNISIEKNIECLIDIEREESQEEYNEKLEKLFLDELLIKEEESDDEVFVSVDVDMYMEYILEQKKYLK